MFKHQIIEDMLDKTTHQKAMLSTAQIKTLKRIRHFLLKAQPFYFGDWDHTLAQTMKTAYKTQALASDLSPEKLKKTPYPTVLFCVTQNDYSAAWKGKVFQKRATLVHYLPERTQMFLMAFMSTKVNGKNTGWDFKAGILRADLESGTFGYGPLVGFEFIEQTERTIIQHDLQAGLNSFAIMLKLLNCINIGVKTIDPPNKLNAKRKRAGKMPMFSYKTLVLKPIGIRQQSIPQHLWNNRIHLQRGHTKTYTEKAPLFGKYAGTYWWQPHARGQNKNGIVMKDYRVEP